MKIIIILLTLSIMSSCGVEQKSQHNKTITQNAEVSKNDIVEVLYFHGKQRCVTCNAIEKLSKEVVENNFSQQLKDGKIVFKVVDISTVEGEKIADKYEVTWSSLFVNKFEKGVEKRHNLTEIGFGYAKNQPEIFKKMIQEEITKIME